MEEKSHSPQDSLYGPLIIPSYCWEIIDKPEFQRLRFISQLGITSFVYPGANHTRFEHSLGCCHLASIFMRQLCSNQPELKITENQIKAVVIAALCHDLGHGPFSNNFTLFAKSIDPKWSHRKMSAKIFSHIIEKYNIKFVLNETKDEVKEAAICFIEGVPYEGYPEWLSNIIINKNCKIDINTFDSLARDNIKTISTNAFEYDRLIVNCRVLDDNRDGKSTKKQLAWKISEVPTIEWLFFTRNDMDSRVYKHRVVYAIGLMLYDVFEYVAEKIGIEEFKAILNDPEKFVNYDDNILYEIEQGEYGEEAKQIIERIKTRDLYKMKEEQKIKPETKLPPAFELVNKSIIKTNDYRITKINFKYGLAGQQNPLLAIPFWKSVQDAEGKTIGKEILNLAESDLSSIGPASFREYVIRSYTVRELKEDSDLHQNIKNTISSFLQDINQKEIVHK